MHGALAVNSLKHLVPHPVSVIALQASTFKNFRLFVWVWVTFQPKVLFFRQH
jgi:hypothetical protein